MGVGFAIPVNMIKSVAEQLMKGGKVIRGFLGITIQNLTPALAESFSVDSLNGIIVAQVSTDSPADKAGLKQGDLIIRYRGETVKDTGSFRNQVSLTLPGTDTVFEVIRKGKRVRLQATIGELSEQKVVSASAESSSEIGLSVQTITSSLAKQFNTEAGKGVVVTHVDSGSLAEKAGIEVSTVIFEVNHHKVTNAEQFKELIEEGQHRALMLIGKGEMMRFVVLSW